MTNPRDSQFSEWAKLTHDEQLSIDDERLTKGISLLAVYAKQRIALARRAYDLAMFIVSQAFENEFVPDDILYKKGRPILMYPENLAEWFKERAQV